MHPTRQDLAPRCGNDKNESRRHTVVFHLWVRLEQRNGKVGRRGAGWTSAKAGRCTGVPDRKDAPQATLGPFLQAWLDARRGDYKPSSLTGWGLSVKSLTKFFGGDCSLADITPARAESFRQSMLDVSLRPSTIYKRLQHSRMFLDHAKRQGLVAENPFEFVRNRQGDVSERRVYVPAADVGRLIEYAPDGVFKLLVALSRFGGLRVPSEALSLRWRDIDWERSRITVPSPKTAHLPGRGYRVIPMFPPIKPYLEAAWDDAPDGAEYIFPEEWRRQAQRVTGWCGNQLRTKLAKVIRRAGLEPWSRPWHSLRASCETDLARQFPLATAAKWLGNTQAVAMRHYVDVTDTDFEKAIVGDAATEQKAAHNPAQQLHEMPRKDPQTDSVAHEDTHVLQGFASSCDSTQGDANSSFGPICEKHID